MNHLQPHHLSLRLRQYSRNLLRQWKILRMTSSSQIPTSSQVPWNHIHIQQLPNNNQLITIITMVESHFQQHTSPIPTEICPRLV